MTFPTLRIDSARTLGQATLVRDALRNQGIEAELRGKHRNALVGELPMSEAEIEIWISEADAPRARRVINELRRPSSGPA